MCTDGAAVNLAMYHLVKEEVDDHYMFTLCPAHKIELARSDTCKESALNNNCIQNCVIIIIIINLYFMLSSPFFVFVSTNKSAMVSLQEADSF